jgi:predicted porin
VSTEVEKDTTEEGTDRTQTTEQSYAISYETEINPALLLALDFTLDITDEENDVSTREVTPSVDLGLEAVWWDFTANWERSKVSSDDPEQQTTVDETWDLELTTEPQGGVVPSTTAHYQRDENEEGGDTQTIDKTIEASLDYSVWEDRLGLTFDIAKDTSDDKVNPDSDTEDRSYNLEVTFDYDYGDNLAFTVEWSNDRQQSVTLSDDDDVLEKDDTLDNNLRGQIQYNLFDGLELTLDREIEWAKDLELGPLETTDTWTGEAAYGASLTEAVDVDLDFSEERVNTDGTESDSDTTTRDYAVALDFAPFDNITFTSSFDRSDQTERFDDSSQENTDTVDDQWEFELNAAFWYDQIEFTIARTFSNTEEQGQKTEKNRDWDIDVTILFDGIPNLELSPEYTFTQTKDLLQDTTDEERIIDFGVGYEISLNDVLILTLDHTYTRTRKDPAEGQSTIQRDDDTDLTLSWDEFLRGMSLELNMTRQASDESEDDKEAVIDYTYIFFNDTATTDIYTISFEFTQDDLDDSEDTRNILTTFSAEFLDGLLTIDFEYEIDKQLEGSRDKNERYLFEITGQF